MSEIKLPWRADGLSGSRSDSGPTYDGGSWTGGGPSPDRHASVRLWAPMGAPASVELGLGERGPGLHYGHGCSVSLTPPLARELAAAIVEASARSAAEMQRWRGVVDRRRQQINELMLRQAEARAGVGGADG